jgi:hypothetical protein
MVFRYKEIEGLILSGDKNEIKRGINLAKTHDIDIKKLIGAIEKISIKYCWFYIKGNRDIINLAHALSITPKLSVYTKIDKKEFKLLTKLVPNVSHIDIYDTTYGNSWPDFSEFEKIDSLFIQSAWTKTLPSWLTKIKTIKRLDINCHKLTEIPSNIGNLHSLNSLSLGIKKGFIFPKSIKNLTELKTCKLFCEEIPKNLDLFSSSCILSIRMNATNFWLPEPILQVPLNITHLNLCLWGGEIPFSIKNLVKLKHLTLDSLIITKVPQGLEDLSEQLESITIEKCNIRTQNIQKLKDIFPNTLFKLKDNEHELNKFRIFIKRYIISVLLMIDNYFSKK